MARTSRDDEGPSGSERRPARRRRPRRRIALPGHLRTALVATQYFHVPRTALALSRHGVDVVGSRHARFAEARDAYSLAREVIAVPVYLFQG